MIKQVWIECYSGLNRVCRDQSGATSIEYAIIAAGISLVILGAVYSIGSTVNGSFEDVQNNYRQIP